MSVSGVRLAADLRVEPLVGDWAAWLMLLSPDARRRYNAGLHLPILRSYLKHPERHADASADPRLHAGRFADLPFPADPSVQEAIGELERLLSADDEPPQRIAIWWQGQTRAHFLNTPRLDVDPRLARVDVRFDDPALAALLELSTGEHDPVDARRVITGLGLEAFFDRMLAPPSSPTATVSRSTDGIEYLGHCSVLVRQGGRTVLVDPVTPPIAATLPERIDAVMLTHGHPDHLVSEALLAIRARTTTVLVPAAGSAPADPSLRTALRALGFGDVHELSPFESFDVGGMTCTALPFAGEHGGLPIDAKAVWHIAGQRFTSLVAADCAGVDPHRWADVRRRLGPVDALFIAMEPVGAPAAWLYGPLMQNAQPDGRLDGADAETIDLLAEITEAERVYVYGRDDHADLAHLFGRPPHQPQPARASSERLIDLCAARATSLTFLSAPAELSIGGR